MSLKHFFGGLAIITFAQLIVIFVLVWSVPAIATHGGFMLVTVSAMIIFSALLYAAAKISARSTLTRLFIQLIMIAVFLKMLLCLALIIGYKKGFEPSDHSFIWPFLFIYLTSTLFEVIFLERVGREKHISKT